MKCDGYKPKNSRKRGTAPPQVSIRPAARKVVLFNSWFRTALSSAPDFADGDEKRYFQFFSECTVIALLPYYNTDQWRRLILQASAEPAIRHVLMALGALHRIFIERVDSSDCLSKPATAEQQKLQNEHHLEAIQHYSKAIRLMKVAAGSSTQPLRMKLLTCLVIICFEAFHGNLDLADTQLQIGLKLLHEWRKHYKLEDTISVECPSPAPNVVEHELVQCFDRLEVQSLKNFTLAKGQEEGRMEVQDSIISPKIPRSFTNFEEANNYLDLGVARLQPHMYPNPGSNQNSPEYSEQEAMVQKQNSLQSSFDILTKWHAAFDKLLDNPLDEIGFVEALSLQARHKDYLVRLMTLMPTVNTNHQLVAIFNEIVNDAEGVLCRCRSFRVPAAGYYFQQGVIMPLYVVGLRCSSHTIRSRAIKILLSRSWREMFLDSVVAGKIAQWVQSREEEFIEGDVTPTWAQIRDLEQDYDYQAKEAYIVCKQRETPESTVTRELRTTIRW